MRAANLDISPPNAKLNMKAPQVEGNITGPKASSANVELSMPKADLHNPHLRHKAPELDVDDPSFQYKGPSYKKRRSDLEGVNLKMPALDVDGDVKRRHTGRKSAKSKARSSFPLVDSDLGYNIDFTHPDLNIDDFTGKDHVLRARGSTLDLQASNNHHRQTPAADTDIKIKHQRSKEPGTDAHLPNFSRDLRRNVSDAADGYYVTVFPTHAQSQKTASRRANTLGRLDFNPGNIDLEVPDENDMKGSTFFFSNLI